MTGLTPCLSGPLPAYDLSVMPPEERILALIDYWCGKDLEKGLARFARYGLPPVAMQDMSMEYDARYRGHFARPENRACNKLRRDWNIIAVILARGGSKGLPGKALRKLGGVPLISLAVCKARAIRDVKRIIVNTDSPEIAAEAQRAGAEIPFLRPAELATDTALSSWAALFGSLWLSLMEGDFFDFQVVVSATHPLVDPGEINLALDHLGTEDATTLETVAELPTCNNEYFSLKNGHTLEAFPQSLPPEQRVYAQCGAFSITGRGPYYHLCGNYLEKIQQCCPRRTSLVWTLPVHQCVDIDTERDLNLAELILRKKEKTNSSVVAEHTAFKTIKKCSCSFNTNKMKFKKVIRLITSCDYTRSPFREMLSALVQRVRSLGKKEDTYLLGNSPLAENLAKDMGIPFYDLNENIKNKFFQLTELKNFLKDAGGEEQPVLVVDGRAGGLQQYDLEKFINIALKNPDSFICSISSPPVSPVYLKWINEKGLNPVCAVKVNRRQDLPELWARDGVLSWVPVSTRAGSFQQGVKMAEEKGILIESLYDLARLENFLLRH